MCLSAQPVPFFEATKLSSHHAAPPSSGAVRVTGDIAARASGDNEDYSGTSCAALVGYGGSDGAACGDQCALPRVTIFHARGDGFCPEV